METHTKSEIERFNRFWVKKGKCKLWQNFLDRDGYGSFYFRRKLRRAHRVAFYFHKGEIQKGMFIDHICKKRNCVEPSHLRLVTPKENSLNNSNSIGAINARKKVCKYGHPFDRKYGNVRYCSVCQAQKTKRLRAKWRKEDTVLC